ncbi:unnamed protein product [Durusdinium trenchii]|uniref:Uncharacterized protein n=2 Tax=Durusdinium trenchii TaxID=1381693 RepID=A0ABP0RYX7_9DINO
MLPNIYPEDLKGFAPAVSRAARLLSVASLGSVVLQGRRSFAAARSVKLTGAGAEEEKETPLGVAALLMLLAAEVVGGNALLQPAKDWPLKQAAQTVQKALQKPQTSMLERAVEIVLEVLKSKQVFAALHSAVMICLLLGALLTAVVGTVLSGGNQRKASHLAFGVGLFLPVGFLLCGHATSWSKALRPSNDLVTAFEMLLRCAALVVANDATPSSFAVFQVASLMAKMSAAVATLTLAQDLAPVRADWHKLVDSHVAQIWLPILLALLWLLVRHLRSSTLLSCAAMLSLLTSPVALALAWPEAAKLMGLPGKPEAGLTRMVNLLYALTAAASLISEGSMGVLAVMLVLQLLARIHGAEIFNL